MNEEEFKRAMADAAAALDRYLEQQMEATREKRNAQATATKGVGVLTGTGRPYVAPAQTMLEPTGGG